MTSNPGPILADEQGVLIVKEETDIAVSGTPNTARSTDQWEGIKERQECEKK
jgi:hypothetical protein